ncbi:MAG: cupin-like domain-containing protein [Steroidobacteraceae bacterium]
MPHSIPEWHDVDARTFREQIVPGNQPAVLRGMVAAWPAVAAGRESAQAMAQYLSGLEQGGPVPILTAPASVRGRFFYRDDLRGPNFERRQGPLAAGIAALLAHLADPDPPAIYMEAARIRDCLPTFANAQRLELLDASVAPRIWIGNAVTVQTHYDLYSNLACVVCGRRRFSLFPPEQLPNLYPSSLDVTLAGVPVSMVRLDRPDYDRYPRFRLALEHLQVAELGPGDALYIPYAWWHHVESLTAFNVLVNYWWNDTPLPLSPMDSLLHATFALRDLPPEQRLVWRALFDYYAFRTSGDPLAHLPPTLRGLMGAQGSQALQTVRALLLRSLA